MSSLFHRLDGWGISVVLRSETTGVEVGKYVYGVTICLCLLSHSGMTTNFWNLDPPVAHQEYTVYPELGRLQILETHPGLSLATYVTAAGMPGWCYVVLG
jgi:hypothetical protein